MSRRHQKRPWHRSPLTRSIVAVSVAMALGAAAHVMLDQGRLVTVREQASDFFYPDTSPEAAPGADAVAVVGIDRRSIAELDERWPWSREVHATLTRNLSAAGAGAIAFDVLFDFPGEGDEAFAAAIAESGRVVLGVDAGTTFAYDEAADLLRSREAERLPLEELRASGALLGHLSAPRDPDGVVRALPLVVETTDRRFMPSLALAAIAVGRGTDPTPVLRADGVQVGEELHPTLPGRSLRINWIAGMEGPPVDTASAAAGATGDGTTATYLSAVDVVRGDFDPADVRGRIVFIGATDPLLGDMALTPVAKGGAGVAGVYAHANAAGTMLSHTYRAAPSPRYGALAAGALALTIGLVAMFVRLWITPLAGILLLGSYFALVDQAFLRGATLDLLFPGASLVMAGVAGLGFRYISESRERRLVSNLFSQYVPKEVAQQLLDAVQAESAAEGQRLDVTVWFCDLRGFTAIAAVREPADVRRMLGVYYDHGTRIVLEHGGTLMQYVGDEIFAVFGAPVPSDDHCQRAVDCAIAMQRAAAEMAKELEELGLPELSYGIGVNTGPVVAAHIGGALRRQYGVIGDTVNVGARLCALAQPGEITLPEAVRRQLVDEPQLEHLGPVALKGVTGDPQVQRVVLPGVVPLAERTSKEEDKARVIGPDDESGAESGQAGMSEEQELEARAP